MGVSTYYEVVSNEVLNEITADAAILSAFESLWGYGGGMYSWFEDIDADEIEEITDGQSKEAVKALEKIISSTDELPSAYVEKTHEIHISILTTAFAEKLIPEAAELATLAIDGASDWEHSDRLQVVGPEHSKQLASAMRGLSVAKSVEAFDLGDRTPVEYWREDLGKELKWLVKCYRYAAKHNHQVLIGLS